MRLISFRMLAVIICLLFTGNSVTTSAQKVRTYKIIPAESNLWVYVVKGGLLSALAHNHNIGVRSFGGVVTVPESGASGGALTLDIDARSLNVADQGISDKDRTEITNSMHNEVLHSDKYSRITFKSTDVSEVKAGSGDRYNFTVNGDLTLHGVTKRIAVLAMATITAQEIKASGKYVLKQSLFGITPYSKAGGVVKVKDDVIVNFSMVARAQ